MNILAFDTCLNKTYLALQTKYDVYTQIIESTEEKYHSAYLIQKIVDILKQNNLRLQDIDLISTNIGPGSFTGIRVGLTVARVMAQGINSDVIGINSLEMISSAYSENALAILDARKNKAYVGNKKNVQLIDLDYLPEFLMQHNGDIIVDTKMQEFLKMHNIEAINFENDNKNFAETLLYLAIQGYEKKTYTIWENLKPLYIQPPPIHKKTVLINKSNP